jgi:cytidine diphosphoramidate kinase
MNHPHPPQDLPTPLALWLIGMSGSGKTTLATALYRQLKPRLPNLVLLDGDTIREVLGQEGHALEGRARQAERLSRLTKFLTDQNLHVIAAVLSIFPDWQHWNRKNIPGYFQIYLQTPLIILEKRDSKGLYRAAREGREQNVVGIDIEFPEPIANDLTLDTSTSDELELKTERILKALAKDSKFSNIFEN